MLVLLFAEVSLPIAGFVLGGISGAIGVALIAKLFPNKPYQNDFSSTRSKEDLAREYGKWENAALIPFLIFTGILGLLLWGLYLGIQQLFYLMLPEASLFFPCLSLVFLAPAVFQAGCLAYFLTYRLYKYLLGDRFPEFEHYSKLKSNFNERLVMRWLAIGVFVISIPFLILMYDCYLRATPTALYDNPWLSFGEIEIPYAEIDEIQMIQRVKAPNGEVHDEPYVRIRYRKDGLIDFRLGGVYLTPEEVQPLIDYIQKQRAVPIKKYLLAPDS